MTEDPRISEIRAAFEAWEADVAIPLEYLADTVRAVLKADPPASQTEWGRRWTDGTVRGISDSRAQAEDTIFPTTQLVRREVGPWTEVQP